MRAAFWSIQFQQNTLYIHKVKIEYLGIRTYFRRLSALIQKHYVHSGSYSLSLFRRAHSQKGHFRNPIRRSKTDPSRGSIPDFPLPVHTNDVPGQLLARLEHENTQNRTNNTTQQSNRRNGASTSGKCNSRRRSGLSSASVCGASTGDDGSLDDGRLRDQRGHGSGYEG